MRPSTSIRTLNKGHQSLYRMKTNLTDLYTSMHSGDEWLDITNFGSWKGKNRTMKTIVHRLIKGGEIDGNTMSDKMMVEKPFFNPFFQGIS